MAAKVNKAPAVAVKKAVPNKPPQFSGMSAVAKSIILEKAAHNQPSNLILYELAKNGCPYSRSYVQACILKFRRQGLLPQFHPGTNIRCHRGRDGNVILRSSFYEVIPVGKSKSHYKWGRKTSSDHLANDDHFDSALETFDLEF